MWYNAFKTNKEYGFYDNFYECSGGITVPIVREISGDVAVYTEMKTQKYTDVAKEDLKQWQIMKERIQGGKRFYATTGALS